MTDLNTYVAALASTWEGLSSACTNLTPDQWAAPTDLPGWTVKDNVSHVTGVELLLLGEPQPDHTPPDLPHVRGDFGRFMEVHVDLRRPVPGDDVLRELRSVVARRLAMLRGYTEADLETEVQGVVGTSKLKHVLGIRVFDCWTHEQDVRRALGHPGGLSTPAAEVSRRRLLLALSGVLGQRVPAVADRAVVVETTGPLAGIATVRPGVSVTDGADPDAAVGLATDFATFMRLGTGRVAYDAVASSVALTGDVALGEQVARNLAVTP